VVAVAVRVHEVLEKVPPLVFELKVTVPVGVLEPLVAVTVAVHVVG
jgi:hypothetical protein